MSKIEAWELYGDGMDLPINVVIVGGHFSIDNVKKMFPDMKYDDYYIMGIDKYGYMQYRYLSEDDIEYSDIVECLEPDEKGRFATWLWQDTKPSGVYRKATYLECSDSLEDTYGVDFVKANV